MLIRKFVVVFTLGCAAAIGMAGPASAAAQQTQAPVEAKRVYGYYNSMDKCRQVGARVVKQTPYGGYSCMLDNNSGKYELRVFS